jgi:hypothetical protein
MLCQLLAYDEHGKVVATLSYCVAKDEDGNVVGLIDFEAYESQGAKLRDIWNVSNAVGSATWPEYLGGAAHDFKVELDENNRIVALVHGRSRRKRKRSDIEAAIAERRAVTPPGEPVDLRDIVGGPNRPLLLDEEGRTQPRPAKSQRPAFPIVRRETG